MADEFDLTTRLQAKGLSLVGEICRDPGDASKYYVFVESATDKKGVLRPSDRSLRRMSKEFEGMVLTFVRVDASRETEDEKIEAALTVMLKKSFPDVFKSTYAAFFGEEGTIWVTPNRILTKVEKNEIEEQCTKFLEYFSLSRASLRFNTSSNLPTQTACLNALRLKAPATQTEIETQLKSLNFSVPNSEWLTRVLDKVRKSGLVIRNGDKTFALTYKGLQSLGTLMHGRSPDIRRALDLARRDV